MLKSNKIWGILIILTTGVYISAATYKDIGVWENWRILYAARKINSTSAYKHTEKLWLNDRAMRSSPSPWLIMQRIDLYNTIGNTECCTFEKERLKTLWNKTEKEMK
jgi:hypothetical protein